MALHILLADDSVPAQNMGKKILTEAGYDVTTVSNGLEALRKIADTIPDIAILDIFMPGYSGLEICQKMRAGTATASLPIILTVGKLEPYRAEDGEKVHSNAIIVKPFAAAELIAAVHSLVGAPPAAPLPASNPLEHSKFAGAFASPLASAPHAEPEPEEPADEPLFTYGSSLRDEPEPHPASNEAGLHPAEPPGQAVAEDAQSLVYNPDAAPTPFRATATDLLSSMPESPTASEESPFTEFGLESSESVYSSAPEQSAPEILSAASPNETSEAPEPVSAATPSAYPEVPFDFEPLSTDDLTLDPLLEIPEDRVSSSILDSNLEGVGEEAPEGLMIDGFLPPESASSDPLNPEEAARLKAFEDLFNSPELPPLEPSPVVDAAMHMDILPSISHSPDEVTTEVQQDPELEILGHDAPSTPHAAQSDPELLQEEEPRTAIGNIPDRDAMLDDLIEPDHGHAGLEELLPSFDDQFSVHPHTSFELEESAAPAILPEVESPAIPAETAASAETPEPVELAPAAAAPVIEHSAEPVTPAPETAPVAAEAVPEQIATIESRSVDSEPVELASEPSPVPTPHEPEPEPAAVAAPFIPAPVAEPAHVFFEMEAQQAPVEAAPAPPEVEAPAVVEPPAVEPPVVEAQTLAAPLPEPAAPEPASAPPAPEAAPLAAEEPVHEAETPAPALAKSVASRSIISELATFGSGAGIAASLSSLVHYVEREGRHVIAPAAPPASEPHPSTLATEAQSELASPAVQHEVAEPAPSDSELDAPSDAELAISAPHAPDHELTVRSVEAEHIHEAVERVFDRFKPLLIAAIVRELARHD